MGAGMPRISPSISQSPWKESGGRDFVFVVGVVLPTRFSPSAAPPTLTPTVRTAASPMAARRRTLYVPHGGRLRIVPPSRKRIWRHGEVVLRNDGQDLECRRRHGRCDRAVSAPAMTGVALVCHANRA